METLPIFIHLLFGATVLLSIFLLSRATRYSGNFLLFISLWAILQSIWSLTGFYTVTDTIPPRFLGLILPPLLLIVIAFNTQKGKNGIDQLDIKALVLVHVVRIPVELVLFWLSEYKVVPALITFEGINLDILSGISAPIIYYLFFVKKLLPKSFFLAWNFVCLFLVLNVVIHAILSVPTAFQQFAFDQPAIAIGYFPFVLLPACVVPIVLFSHLVIIRRLLIKSKTTVSLSRTKISTSRT